MLRVCGITYVRTTNYGTCFQAYALQKAINGITLSNGEKCQHEFIPLWHCSDYALRKKRFLHRLLLSRFRKIQEEKIQYLECNKISELYLLNDSFDAFVCGSDVIWNPRFNLKMGSYYLDFAKKYKFSYAASFGQADNLDDDFFQTAGKWISELNEISVREKSSVGVVKKYADRDAVVVADPVILLHVDEWNKVAIQKNNKKKYIFSYTTHKFDEYDRFLKSLSEKTGLKVIEASWDLSIKNRLKKGKLLNQTPEEWLQLIRDAEFVVTNSFHATVFSTLFHKKFFTFVNGKKNEGSKIRMYDYLSSIGLIDRMLSSVPDNINLSDIDYSKPDCIISDMRNEGIAYLQRNLEAAYDQKVSNV